MSRLSVQENIRIIKDLEKEIPYKPSGMDMHTISDVVISLMVISKQLSSLAQLLQDLDERLGELK